jgi:membrane protein implicated in regulation of membrane protease activity
MPAGMMVETREVTATVEAIDQAKRLVTLKGPEGKSRTIKVDPRVKRLPDVKKGDQVVVRHTEGLAIYVKTP